MSPLRRTFAAALATAALSITALGSTAAPSSATPAPEARSKATMSLDGYRRLHPGMSLKAARETGSIRVIKLGDGAACVGFRYAGHRLPHGRVDGYVSHAYGLAGAFSTATTTTARGIEVGSSRREVRRAYPGAIVNVRGLWVAGSGEPSHGIQFQFAHRKVTSFFLGLTEQDCFD